MSQISQATITTPATDPRHIVRLGQVDPASSTSITLPRSPGASVAFTVPVNLAAGLCGVGVKLRAFSESTPAKWLEGTVASYSATTLTLTVTASNGSGAVTDWKLAPSTLSAELAAGSDAAAAAQAAADAAQAAADAAQAAADAAQATADAAQATADAALPASAQAADVNPAGEDIAAALGGKLNTSVLDTDATMAADSDAKVPSQKATRAYVASVLAGVSKNKGPLDCSANPNYPVGLNGDFYRCSVAGKVGGASGVVVEVADLIMCVADNAGGTQAGVGTSWIVGQANIAGITAAGLAMLQAADATAQAALLAAVTDAPSNGYPYARKNGAWARLEDSAIYVPPPILFATNVTSIAGWSVVGDTPILDGTDVKFANPDSVTEITTTDDFDTGATLDFSALTGLTSIGSYAFDGQTNLTGFLTLPTSLTTIGDYAFRACSNLASITIPDSVTSIGDYAFMDNFDVTSLSIGSGVTTIGDGAFSYTDITSVALPSSLTSIGAYAFRSCSLYSFTIPNSVTSIGTGAFDSCPYLSEVNAYVELSVLDATNSLASSGVTTIHARASDGTWTAGAGQTIGGQTGVTVIKDL
jgi:hypothetical protein